MKEKWGDFTGGEPPMKSADPNLIERVYNNCLINFSGSNFEDVDDSIVVIIVVDVVFNTVVVVVELTS